MALPDELERLAELHQRGVLSDDEFARAKARVMGEPAAAPAAPVTAINGWRRSLGDRWIGGVCGGLGQLTGVASWFWRLAFVLAVVCAGTGLLVYLLLWLLVPSEPLPAARPALAGS